jgi:hypothetical protein
MPCHQEENSILNNCNRKSKLQNVKTEPITAKSGKSDLAASVTLKTGVFLKYIERMGSGIKDMIDTCWIRP